MEKIAAVDFRVGWRSRWYGFGPCVASSNWPTNIPGALLCRLIRYVGWIILFRGGRPRMNFPDPLEPDLEILGVADPGVPNAERILIRPTRTVSLIGFGIAMGLFISREQGAMPIHDNVFWFPDMIVEPPALLFVYTNAGKVLQTTLESGEPALVFHWHRPYVLFTDPTLVPVL